MAYQNPQPSMRNFAIIWFGQLVSLLGSGLTSFGLGIWVYQRTNSVTLFAFISLFAMLPGIVLAPLAGALVDRWDRRWVMIFCDTGAALCTLAVVLLLLAGRLEIWQIYVTTAISATLNTFQWPAYAASIPLLVPKDQLGRANGMLQLAQAIGQLFAPVLAGVFILLIRIEGVILIDLISFLFAVVTLLLTRIPRPEASTGAVTARSSLRRDIADGWSFLGARPGLLALLVLFGLSNLMIGLVTVLATPLVLAIASSAALGLAISVGGSGMVLGSLLMSFWGGPKRRIYGMYGCMLLEGLAILVGGVQPSVVLFTIAAFVFFLALPIDAACCQAILQSKVPLAMQGRVFAVQRMFARAGLPLAYLLAGPLADRVFEPLLTNGGSLAGSVGQIIGVGPGRGIGLLFVVCGALYMLLAAGSYLYPRLRLVELELPDVISQQAASAVSDGTLASAAPPITQLVVPGGDGVEPAYSKPQ